MGKVRPLQVTQDTLEEKQAQLCDHVANNGVGLQYLSLYIDIYVIYRYIYTDRYAAFTTDLITM